MKRIGLSMKYDKQYQVIKDLVDHHGNKKRAALKLGISVRQVNRRIKQYQDKGKAAFVHGNVGRKPVNCLTTEINNQIVTLYLTKYQDCNLKHFVELLDRFKNISVSYSKVYGLLKAQDILSPKPWKKTKRSLAKKKWHLSHPKQNKKEIEAAASHQLALEDAHPRHERCKYFDEEIQMDASDIVWFGSKKASLHLAIDNATGLIVGAYFDWQETLNGYYHVFEQILKDYGIPLCFKTDNQTVQSRLKPELRLAGIDTIEEANQYLRDMFVPDFNRKFGQEPRKAWSAFEKVPSDHEINYTLAVLSSRVFDSGSAISFKNQLYQAADEYGRLVCFMKGTKCLVIEALDGQLLVTVDERVYQLKEIHKHAPTSPELDKQPKKKRTKKKYIPPMSHPWKRESFLKQQERRHKYHQYA